MAVNRVGIRMKLLTSNLVFHVLKFINSIPQPNDEVGEVLTGI
jgi:hypothetical protein